MIRVLVLTIGIIVILIGFGICWTPRINNPNQESVAYFERITLGGVKQSVLIRGRSIDNPILIYLHGGPGSSEMSPVRHFLSPLEEDFIMVSWEQRGTGKSYRPWMKASQLSMEQYVSDLHELVIEMTTRFNQSKVYILAHSWGTALGITFCHQYPELVTAYIGTGQGVDWIKGEKISYNFTLEKAVEQGNKKAIKELNSLTTQNPYLTIDSKGNWYKILKKERKWLVKFGGEIFGQSSYKLLSENYIRPEYSLYNMIAMAIGSSFSLKAMIPNIMKMNFSRDITSLEIPVYFLQGAHDYNTPTELVVEYYDQLVAPKKNLVLFKSSAHMPQFEESDLFIEKVREIKEGLE